VLLLIFSFFIDGMLGEYFCLAFLPIVGLFRVYSDGKVHRIVGFFQPVVAFLFAFLVMMGFYQWYNAFLLYTSFISVFGVVYWIGTKGFAVSLASFLPFGICWAAFGEFYLFNWISVPYFNFAGFLCYLLFSVKLFELVLLFVRNLKNEREWEN
jgi:hypothetical protein